MLAAARNCRASFDYGEQPERSAEFGRNDSATRDDFHDRESIISWDAKSFQETVGTARRLDRIDLA
jgi:hypothetical protein